MITDATSGLTGLCAVLVAVAGTAAVLAACVQRPEGSVRLRGDAQLVERAKTVVEGMGARVMGPAEVREKLKLVKHD